MKKPIDIDLYLGDYTFQVVYDRWSGTLERTSDVIKYLMDKGEGEADLFETVRKMLEISHIETVAYSLAFVAIYDMMIKKMDRYEYPYDHDLSRKRYRHHLNTLFEYTPMV